MTDDQKEFLDQLRESGITNMFGARVYVEREFGLDRREAKEIVLEWMKTFKNNK